MIRPTLAVLAFLGFLPISALAQTSQVPVALVEDIVAKNAGVDFMDYLPTGKVIDLASGETLTLSYLKSCARETIAGGRVTVGVYQSTVDGGTVERDVVKCDGGKLALTTEQSAKSGAMIFRRPPPRSGALPEADLTLFGTAPVLIVPDGGVVVIERLDAAAEKLEISAPPQELRPGAFHDLAAQGTALIPGGLYRASVDRRQIVFKVSPAATAGRGPLIGRLLQFPTKLAADTSQCRDLAAAARVPRPDAATGSPYAGGGTASIDPVRETIAFDRCMADRGYPKVP